ncbi:MAG: ankyrin repeat domain-containing protein, partial [Parachlamydiaceae bacterium]
KNLKKAILTSQTPTRSVFTDQKSADLALYNAVKHRELDVVQFLLDRGANPDLSYQDIRRLDLTIQPSQWGHSLLDLSLKQKTFRITQVLLQAKATIDADLLHQAARIPNNQKNIRLLLKYGADPNGSHPVIFSAISSKSLANLRTLIKGGADPNSTRKKGQTALHLATKSGERDLMELLIQHGADINYADKDGQTALHVATDFRERDLMKLLIQHGADINSADKKGQTALHLAADSYKRDLMELLIQHGADINYADKKGRTALDIAAQHGTPEMIELLIKQ